MLQNLKKLENHIGRILRYKFILFQLNLVPKYTNFPNNAYEKRHVPYQAFVILCFND